MMNWPAQREAIEPAYFRGLTRREIAGLLGVPPGTLKPPTWLGLGTLRDLLGDVGETRV